ncbi:MAG: haloacid dehalogenase type II [Novosphingobium sp.]
MTYDATLSLLTRRDTISALALAAATLPQFARAAPVPIVDAIAFDGFPIFDPRPVGALAKRLFPDRGEALALQWNAKLFGYAWLYTSAGQYAGFDALADASLRYTAEALQLVLSDRDRSSLVDAYAQLDIWPDVRPALLKLRAAGVRLGFLSNLSEATLRANMARNGIAELFEQVLSTDRVRQFKPARAAYAMAPDAFGLPKSRIGFAAFGGWDAAGAAWFGYRTAWVNRLGVPREPIEPGPSITAPGMDAVLALAGLV